MGRVRILLDEVRDKVPDEEGVEESNLVPEGFDSAPVGVGVGIVLRYAAIGSITITSTSRSTITSRSTRLGEKDGKNYECNVTIRGNPVIRHPFLFYAHLSAA